MSSVYTKDLPNSLNVPVTYPLLSRQSQDAGSEFIRDCQQDDNLMQHVPMLFRKGHAHGRSPESRTTRVARQTVWNDFRVETAITGHPPPTDPDVTNFRVDWGLPMLQAEVCILCCHLVSRWCHNISAIHRLLPSPSQNRTSGFPNIRLLVLPFSKPPPSDRGPGRCEYAAWANRSPLTDLERKLNPPVRHEVRKIGRNETCTCGSGKKLKQCCGANN